MRSSRHLSDSDVKPNWSIIKSLIPYLLEYKGRVALALFFLVCAKLASVATPWLMKLIVDDLDAQRVAMVAPVALLLFYGMLKFLSALFGEIRDTVFSRVSERAMRRVAKNVFEHLHTLDLDFHLSRKTGGLSRDIERGTSGINFLLRFLVFNIIPTFLELFMVFAIMWGFFSWHYCVVVLLVVVIYVVFSIVVTEWRTKFIRAVNEHDSRSNTRAVDSLLNYETVKYFNNEHFEVAEYDRELSLWEQARIRIRFTLSFLNSGQAFIIAASVTVMLLMASHDVVHKTMSLGDFVMISAYMIQLFIPLNFLGFVYREIRQALINIEKMFDLLDIQSKVQDHPHAKILRNEFPDGCEIQFENVCFSYDAKRKVLKNVSFTLHPGETLAIVGASGAGKSTIAKLLFRFYDPTSGSIKINGQDIRELTLDSWRKKIGVVPQDTVLFNDSIYYNISYGAPGSSTESILAVADRAHLTDFINKLPEGYETLVGERGLKVSGGEKQRLAIARVLLKNPPILVFDEATSSLDTEAERVISRALDELATRHSTVIIAHRLSTVLNANHIIVLCDGEIIEQGKHQEMVAAGGHYAKLWSAQSREVDTAIVGQ